MDMASGYGRRRVTDRIGERIPGAVGLRLGRRVGNAPLALGTRTCQNRL